MQQMTRQQELIIQVCDDLKATLLKKDADYGSSFSEQYKEFGIVSGVIRLNDKLNRLKNLIKGNPNLVGEAIEDTVLDNAGYSVLIAVERIKEKEVGNGKENN
jgi:hypothetical protein